MLAALVESASFNESRVTILSSGRKFAFGKSMIVAECKIIYVSVLEPAKVNAVSLVLALILIGTSVHDNDVHGFILKIKLCVSLVESVLAGDDTGYGNLLAAGNGN